MNHITTHWSADNRILAKKLHEQVESEITTRWKGVWYKRLWFYFFEQEIRADVRQSIEGASQTGPHHLLDPEYQALLARSAKNHLHAYETWDEMTLLVNDYIFSQGNFLEKDYGQADEYLVHQMIALFAQGSSPANIENQGVWMSDTVLELRRARADVAIVNQIQEGKHTYQTLLKICGEYMGTFARVPRFVELYPMGWSMETLMAAIDDGSRLDDILAPTYTLECAPLDHDMIVPYGYVQVEDTPYSTWFGKIGYRWAQSAWYIKLGVSALIVFLSLWLGGSTLIILPIVWGLIAVARTESQYLDIFQTLLSRWYQSYTDQRNQYVHLYDTMVDPEQSTDDTVNAQQLMSRWFDVIPFSGHELMWDATDYAKRLYGYVMLFSGDESIKKDVAMMEAIANWSSDHHLSLLIIQDGQYTEQALYRFSSLLSVMKGVVHKDALYEQEYIAQYESIDELISGKKYNFWLWTFRNALRDGALVAVSSGVLGWMGSYLWNWGVGGNTAFAASPSLMIPTVTQSDDLLSHTALLDTMEKVMTVTDIDRFMEVIQINPSDTLWDTMVDTFGSTKGNVYTNHLMDTRWRISDDQMTSELFDHAFRGDVPVTLGDSGWENMMNFLHRIYNYDNLQDYTVLLDKAWLSETLQALQSGDMSVSEFADLPVEQREIVTQALFYHLDGDALQALFDGEIVLPDPEIIMPDPVVVNSGTLRTGETITGSLVDTGAQTHTLELGDKLLQWLGLHSTPPTPITTGTVDLSGVTLTGDIDILSGSKLSLGEQLASWKATVASDWNTRFGRPTFEGLADRKTSIGNSWTEQFPLPRGWSWDGFVSWKDSVAHTWNTKFSLPNWLTLETNWPSWPAQDLTGSIDLPDVSVTGDIDVPSIDLTGTVELPDVIITGDIDLPSVDLTGNIDIPDVTSTGDIQLGSGEVSVSGEVAQPGFWSEFRTWLKGTPPVVETQSGSVVSTGVVDTVLSGLNSEDLQLSGTVIDQNALAPGQIAQFTLPLVRKDKIYE